MAKDTYIATRQVTVGAKVFEKGDVLPWSLIGSTGLIKRLLKSKAIKVGTDKRAKA